VTECRHTAAYVTSLRCRTDKGRIQRDHEMSSVLSIGTTMLRYLNESIYHSPKLNDRVGLVSSGTAQSTPRK
jgi:hypothetical protein